MSTEITKDTQADLLNKQVNELRTLRTNMKPWLAFVVGIAFILLGALFIHGMLGILLIVLGVAGILATLAALNKRAGIDQRIVELEKQIESLNSAPDKTPKEVIAALPAATPEA
jgi:hypothetical protein